MKYRLSVGLIFCVAVISLPLVGRAQSIIEQKETVAFIFGTLTPRGPDGKQLSDPSGNPLLVEGPLGTGFFVFYQDTRLGPDGGFTYFVTAKHVLMDSNDRLLQKVTVRINLKKRSTGPSFDMVRDIPVADSNGGLLWLHDTQDAATDIAAFPWLPDPEKYEFKAIPISMFLTDDEFKSERIAEGDSLYFIGLMAPYYGENRNYPVVRRGTLALLTDEKIPTPTGRQDVHIVELNSWPGNSGSPVFLNLAGQRPTGWVIGEKLRFFGVLVGYFENKVIANTVPAATIVAGNEWNIGISFVVPADRLRAVLESPEAAKLRDEELARKGSPKP